MTCPDCGAALGPEDHWRVTRGDQFVALCAECWEADVMSVLDEIDARIDARNPPDEDSTGCCAWPECGGPQHCERCAEAWRAAAEIV